MTIEQRKKKGVEVMMLWIKIVESIFKCRGQARQEQIDTWLTASNPVRNWKDRHRQKEDIEIISSNSNELDGAESGGDIQDLT